jgi:hypothetical protein
LAAFVLAAFLAAALLIAASCGDDDDGGPGASAEPDAEAEATYFQELATAIAAVNAQLDSLDQLRTDAFDSGADAAAAAAYGTAYEAYMTDRQAALQALMPPESLAAEHTALAAAAADTQALAADLAAALASSPPADEAAFQALFGDLDGATITGRYRDACTALQTQATAAGLESDLDCLR